VATSSGEAMLGPRRQEPGLTQLNLVVGQLPELTGSANFGCHRHLVAGSVRPGMNRRAAPLWPGMNRRAAPLGSRYSVVLEGN
jgi:hypothetical protein